MSVSITIPGAVFTDPDAILNRFVPTWGNTGFPSLNIVALHRFKDADPATSSLDDVSGLTTAPSFVGGSAANLAGGGVLLSDGAFYPLHGTLNITTPWTYAVCARRIGGARAGNEAFFGTSLYPVSGLLVYMPIGNPVDTVTHVQPYLRPSVDGANGALSAQYPSTTIDYGETYVSFITHTGGGNVIIEQWDATGATVSSLAAAYGTVTAQGAPGSQTPTKIFGVGSTNANFNKMKQNVEAHGSWQKALTADEKSTAFAAFAALASARARAIV